MIYKPSQSEQAHVFLDKCFERKRWVKVDYIPDARTPNQHGYLWLVLTIIGDSYGMTKEDVYAYYLEKFPTYDNIELYGESKPVRISLSNKERFGKEKTSVFIDRVVIDARQEGLIIPDPTEDAALEAINYYRKRGLL